jgi:hypothetical protein
MTKRDGDFSTGDVTSTSREIALADLEAGFPDLPVKRPPTPEELDARYAADPWSWDWVSETVAGEYLGIGRAALEQRRRRGTGPRHGEKAGQVAYTYEDLDAWVDTKPKGYRDKRPQGPPAPVETGPPGAARRLGLTERQLENMRQRGTGPSWHRCALALVSYRVDMLDDWVASKPKGYRPKRVP